MISTCVNDQALLGSYCKYGPIVSWQRMELPEIQSVAMNQYDGYMLGLEHVIGRGYTRIANAWGRPTSMNTSGRIQAYQDAARTHALTVNPDWSQTGIHSIRQGEGLIRELLLRSGERPNVILCANDMVAAGILSEARRLKVKVPEELAIVGFDNTELAHTLGITSIDNPIAAQAQNALYLIIGKLGEQKPGSSSLNSSSYRELLLE